MTFPDRDNPYNFDEFLSWRNQFNFLIDDSFLQKVIAHYAADLSKRNTLDVNELAEKVSFRWRDMVEIIAQPENAPYMKPFDGYNNRIDRIVRPKEMELFENEVFAEAIFSEKVDPWVTFIKIFLLCQLGEAGINCAHCCTGGLIKILEEFADTPETLHILRHLKEGIDGDYAIAAQFLSEIQGGSDVRANQAEAVNTENGWRIYGTKFYCSAAHADYAVITAKPTESHNVGVFVVPSWLPGDKQRECRNSYVINKLKSKLGTRELPTAEITYEGAVAYPLGDLDKGLANIVGIVLSHSRFVCGLSAGSQLSRIAREAKRYSEWRTAFDMTIGGFALVKMQIMQLELSAKRCTAGAFKLQKEIMLLANEEAHHYKQRSLHVRLLIMIQKLVACTDSANITETAMSIFGGHGLMEDFSALPRLFRDAVVLSGAWEGPRNLLLTRIFVDIQQAADWYEPEALIENLLVGSDSEVIVELQKELSEILAHGTLVTPDLETISICERWDRFCSDLMHAYQDIAVSEVEESSV